MSTLDAHAGAAILVLSCLLVFLAVWTMRVQMQARRAESRLDEIFHGVSNENMARLLAEYLGTVRSTAGAVQRMQQEHARIAGVIPTVVRHVGLVRFSPFHDTGGDQSFTLALLDTRGDGVVVTALHSRHDSRLYAKPIKRGVSEYSLTPEERQAMETAFQSEAVHAKQ